MPSLGFGFEKLGLQVIRAPRTALALVIAFTAFCAVGIPKLQTDGTLSELFRSKTKDFRNYTEMSSRFPTSEFDVLVVIEGKDIMKRDLLEEIRGLHLELQFAQAVDGVISIFSMRGRPDEKGYAPPIFPAELPEGEEFERLAKRAMDHPLIHGKLLSDRDENGQLTLLVLSLKKDVVIKKGLSVTIGEIGKIARQALEPTGLEVQLAGAPVMQLEIRNAIKRDRFIYNGVGFLVGFIINLAFFRRPLLVFIASICPVLSVVWALGILGHLDQRLTTFINVIPPLVMVIAFTDAMHMVFAIRRRMRDGMTRFEASRHAIKTIGPACVLTSLTTAIAMVSMGYTDSGLIRTFGLSAALSTLLAFVAVITVVPILTLLLIRDEEKFAADEEKRYKAIDWLTNLCADWAAMLRSNPVPIAIGGMALLVVFSVFHLQLKPQYRLSDQVPDDKQSVAASQRLDAKLTGSLPVHIMVRWPEGKTIQSGDVINAISEAHGLIEIQSGIGNVWSLDTLRRWLKKNVGDTRPEVVVEYMRRMPAHLTARFVNEKERAALVTGRIPNLDAGDSVPVIRELDRQLNELRQDHKDFTFTVTGLSAVSALQSASMIEQLNRGLIIAVIVVIVLIGVAFRSTSAALFSVLPNLFPIVAAGTFLFITGRGLEYASVIGLTVAFGLAVDDTIHFLNRFYLERERHTSINDAVYETIARIGPVLVLTTIVLVLGLAVTVISDLPAMRLFGQLFMTTLSAALLADMVLLPAILLWFFHIRAVRKEA